jgi:hypothetical protein
LITWGRRIRPDGVGGSKSSDAAGPSPFRTVLRLLVALLVGGFGGLVALVGVLAFRAAVEEVYLHSWGDLYGPYLVAAVVPLLILTVAALRFRHRRFWRWPAFLTLGLILGGGVGALLGSLAVSHASGPWAGGLIGAAGGALAVTLAAAVRLVRSLGREGPTLSGSGSLAVLFALLAATAATTACSPEMEPAPDEVRLEPPTDTAQVTSVIFLLGDPGVARADRYPILRRLRDDVEAWSGALAGRGEVRLLVLGDLVYPEGLHPPSDEQRQVDSLRLASQISVLEGPRAAAVGARGLFLPGNHDWGQEEDVAGAVRLNRLENFLDRWSGSAAGRVELAPPAGDGVEVRDVGAHLRLVLLDTAWWLLGREPGDRERFLDRIAQALRTAGPRRVVVAAHHPWETGGPHGAGVDLGSFLGIRLLLKRAGILVQDLDSRPYASLRTGLMRTFADVSPPSLFVAGHDHSLQVFDGSTSGIPRSLVLGSASKLTGVTGAPGMLFGRSEPGYGKLFVLRDGSLRVEVDAAPAGFLRCTEPFEGCMEEGAAAFRTVWRETVPGPQGRETDSRRQASAGAPGSVMGSSNPSRR